MSIILQIERGVMKRMACVLLMLGATGMLRGEVDDQKIKRVIFGSWCYIDNMNAAERAFDSAWNMCGGDSNRFSRLLYEISLTNDVRHASSAMRLLAHFGTSAQLPYLYSVSTDEIRGAQAVKAILRIEGVTTNSILAVSNCLAQTVINDHERYLAFRDLVERLYRLNPEDSCREFGLNYIRRHALTANEYCLGVDYELKKRDLTYAVSKRRLAVLRSVLALELNDHQRNAVTNAINELVAYPEANLPE